MPRAPFGAPNPPFTGTISGIQNGDNITASYSTTATVSSPVGTCPITASLNDPSGRLGNYSVRLNEGTLTITPGEAQPYTVAYWRFEEGLPGTAVAGFNTVLDSSGNNLNGTAINGPIYSSSVGANPIPQTREANLLSLEFNGKNQRIFIPDDQHFRLTQSLTLEAYINLTAWPPPTDFAQIVFRGDDRLALDPYFLAVLNGQLDFHMENYSGAADVRAPLPGLNQWIYVAGTLDDASGEMKVYINGALVGSMHSNIRPFALLDPLANPGLGIGNLNSANYAEYFPGFIDEVRISNTALAPDQFLDAPPAGGDSRPRPPDVAGWWLGGTNSLVVISEAEVKPDVRLALPEAAQIPEEQTVIQLVPLVVQRSRAETASSCLLSKRTPRDSFFARCMAENSGLLAIHIEDLLPVWESCGCSGG